MTNKDIKQTGLLGCPKTGCNGKAEIMEKEVDEPESTCVDLFIQCVKCGLRTASYDYNSKQGSRERALEIETEVWNTRDPLPSVIPIDILNDIKSFLGCLNELNTIEAVRGGATALLMRIMDYERTPAASEKPVNEGLKNPTSVELLQSLKEYRKACDETLYRWLFPILDACAEFIKSQSTIPNADRQGDK